MGATKVTMGQIMKNKKNLVNQEKEREVGQNQE